MIDDPERAVALLSILSFALVILYYALMEYKAYIKEKNNGRNK